VGELRARTGISDWVGSVGLGVCGMAEAGAGAARQYFAEPALALMAAALPPGSFRLFGPAAGTGERLIAAEGDWIERVKPMLAIVHGDPRATGLVEDIGGLSRDAGLFLLGGVAAAESAPVQVAGRVVEGGLSGVLLAPEITVASGLSQGCAPIGPVRSVTEARDNVVMAIDGRPALEIFKEDIGELLSRDLRRTAGVIFAGLPVRGTDTGDYLVRNLVAIDPARGWIAIAHPMAAGDRLIFCRRDPGSATADLQRMLEQLKRRAHPGPGAPQAGLYFSCVARGPNLFAEPSAEIAMIREQLGDFPVVGFFGNGEISNDRLYGYTGVLALFL
jgi:small ligand-binding sensory domain FIST